MLDGIQEWCTLHTFLSVSFLQPIISVCKSGTIHAANSCFLLMSCLIFSKFYCIGSINPLGGHHVWCPTPCFYLSVVSDIFTNSFFIFLKYLWVARYIYCILGFSYCRYFSSIFHINKSNNCCFIQIQHHKSTKLSPINF